MKPGGMEIPELILADVEISGPAKPGERPLGLRSADEIHLDGILLGVDTGEFLFDLATQVVDHTL